MREIIKLRAWDGLNKEMSLWTMNDLCTYEDKLEKPSALEEWMLFTGMKDKNSKEIYEGDILCYTKIYRGKIIKHYHEVYWDKTGQWRVRGLNIECTHRLYECAPSHEIVGNIYENESLLKKVKFIHSKKK